MYHRTITLSSEPAGNISTTSNGTAPSTTKKIASDDELRHARLCHRMFEEKLKTEEGREAQAALMNRRR